MLIIARTTGPGFLASLQLHPPPPEKLHADCHTTVHSIPFQTVAEDVLVWSVGPKHIVTFMNL